MKMFSCFIKPLVFVLLLISQLLAAAADSLLNNISHPFLLITKARIAQVKEEIRHIGWKEKSWQRLKSTADQYLSQPVEVPPRGGVWEQYYYSPTTNRNLVKGKQIGNWRWQHIDTSNGRVLLGDTSHIQTDYDGIIISFVRYSPKFGQDVSSIKCLGVAKKVKSPLQLFSFLRRLSGSLPVQS